MSVRHAMLALLSEGPKYGLRLREEFEDRTGEVWPLNVGQVYTTLQRLERDGLVESDGSGRTARRRPSGSPLMASGSWPRGCTRLSTLLTIAGTLEEPTTGEVLVAGHAVAGMSGNARARLRRRTIGYVFQDFNLLPGLTAAENVALPLELDGLAARKARVAGLTALERLGLAERAGHYPDQLSGGERQRVAIARAMVGERGLLLADEPSGALDSANGETVMRLLHGACKNGGMTAMVVTHDAQLASWADRVVFLRDGQVTDQTAPAAGPETLLAPGDAR